VRAFDAGLRPSRRPALHFLHIQHPHYPWRYLPDGRSYDAPSPLPPFDARWPAGETAALARSRHLLQVQDADRLLGEILDRLSATGLVDDALVVVTSDHGISFGAGLQPRGVTGVAQGDTAWVPLFVKVPGRQGGRIDDRPASILDVLPTVADVLEMPLDDPDGRSLLRSAGPVERAILAAGGEWLTLPPDAAPRDQALRRAYEEVGTDPRDGHRLFRIGRYGSLVGTVPPAAPTATSRAVLGDAPAFAGVDPRTGRIPAFVTLRIVGEDDTPSVSDGHVIAVNGVIAGTAHVQDRESGTVVVGGLVDPASFRTGRNEIALYAVTGPPSGPSFRRIPLAR
ncbi:MAG: sulfatase-like hydrolase/transferase, partial [Acidimicrobiia bacterium]|nr:sulfatase-like hydrolase/transferase [Acidimicrobiia bacterium]